MVLILIRAATLADARGLAGVHVDAWRTTYRGLISDSYLDGLDYDRSTERWQRMLAPGQGSRIIVAEDESETIVGFASGGLNRDADIPFDAELYAIYILRNMQRSGLGRKLLHSFAGAVAADGSRSLIVWVLAENEPARRFYEAMSGTEVTRRDITIAGQTLEEVSYGWPDIHILLTKIDG